MRVRKGLVLRVGGLQFSCGAPPSPPALDPSLRMVSNSVADSRSSASAMSDKT